MTMFVSDTLTFGNVVWQQLLYYSRMPFWVPSLGWCIMNILGTMDGKALPGSMGVQGAGSQHPWPHSYGAAWLLDDLHCCILWVRTDGCVAMRYKMKKYLGNRKETPDSRNEYASTHCGATGALTYGSEECGWTGAHNMMAELGHKKVRFGTSLFGAARSCVHGSSSCSRSCCSWQV
jgi:hypothetical protein